MRASQVMGVLWTVLAALPVIPGCSGTTTIGKPRDAAPPIDAGTDGSASEDAGCVPSEEVCNRRDDDCDARVDEDFDLTSDPANCGGCGIRCTGDSPLCGTLAGGGSACVSECADPTPVRCGEVCIDTDSHVGHCGECGNECVAPEWSSPSCSAGSCGFACDAGRGDCDGDGENGCETPLDTLADCGACGTGCELEHASEMCSTGSCRISSCRSGWDDCDGADTNGCETPLTSLSDCGSCGTVCARFNATATCSTGSCRIASCDSRYGNCDGSDSNGCETLLTTVTDCGRCGTICSLPNAFESCSTGSCRIASCHTGYDDCNGLASDGCECVI